MRLAVGGQEPELVRSFDILVDPRLGDLAPDLAAQLELLLDIRDRLSATNQLINRVAHLDEQVAAWSRWTAGQSGTETIKALSDALRRDLAAIMEQLIDVNMGQAQLHASGVHEKLNALIEFVDSADHAPARQARQVLAQLTEQLAELTQHFERSLDAQVPALSSALDAAGQPRIGEARGAARG